MRCFIAVDLDPSLTGKIAELQKGLRGPGIKPVKPENMHFTLKFLGEIDDKMATLVKDRLAVLGSIQPFSITLEGIGVFPNASYIRVVWLGAESAEFVNLHEKVNKLLPEFKSDKAVPHLTLARVGMKSPEAEEFVSKNKDVEIGEMVVNCVKLKKSTLTKERPIYEDIEKFKLGF